MAGLSGGGGGGGAAYTYVQDAEPSGAEEGESWYDTGANEAYVFNGTKWVEQTVVDHADLSGVGSSNHHSKPTTAETESPDTLGWMTLYYGDSTNNCAVDAVENTDSTSSGADVTMADGSTYTIDGGNTKYFNTPRYVRRSSSANLDGRVVLMRHHNHNVS